MRPDQDPRLTSMGIDQAACDKCFMELYNNAPDSICDDCKLNPMKRGDGKKFIKEAINHESQFNSDELAERADKMKPK